ncbi:uncharacterized protein C8Q71DRAFT_93819 [Rhodofomes roseus]|uniref:N-acetyltransferase domain-containing protein n=1 Tax=Rhodofomes roseus TaxID=34475 RepID=A0ABQ8KDX1_9APHY|nr:uncharacterized protein C8Q71DRAFT_93819 [Rhodofomes roseus]KAH9835741.1 hypothetical protein C8Q71DRAFT_93819 [Rhodofomes roseus]
MSLLAGYEHVEEKLKPELLAYGDLPHTVDASLRANWDDPVSHYLEDTPVSRRYIPHEALDLRVTRTKVAMYAMFADDIRRREIWTINHGDSIMRFPAPVTVPRGRKALNKLIISIVQGFLKVFTVFRTKEQKKRREELQKKLKATIANALGDRVPELFSLDGLSTAPEKQGLGYASLLVDKLAAIADAQSRGLWLITTSRVTSFYAQFGFKTVGSVPLGEDNPTWKEDPVVFCIMLREPEAASLHLGEKVSLVC